MTVELVEIKVHRNYRVSAVAPVPDTVGCPIDPREVSVRFSNRAGGVLRPTWVEIRGPRLRGAKTKGCWAEGGYAILNGSIVPDPVRGPAPTWVHDLVRAAIEAMTPA